MFSILLLSKIQEIKVLINSCMQHIIMLNIYRVLTYILFKMYYMRY